MKGPKIQVVSKSIISRGSLGVTIILRLFQKGFDRILGETQIILGGSLAWLNFSSLFGGQEFNGFCHRYTAIEMEVPQA